MVITCCRLLLRKSLKWTVDYYKRGCHITPKFYSKGPQESDGYFDPLDGLVRQRRGEAERSLLVEVAGLGSAGNLHQVCSQYGDVHRMFHYTTWRGTHCKDMILVEFQEVSSLACALSDVGSLGTRQVIPACSPLVWLAAKAADERGSSSNDSRQSRNKRTGGVKKISVENLVSLENVGSRIGASGGNDSVASSELRDNVANEKDTGREGDSESINPPDFVTSAPTPATEDFVRQLYLCSDMSQQIQILYDTFRLSELGWRLRFFSCWQVESALSGLFPRATVLPFGSSINSFGNITCDLDMNLELDGEQSQARSSRLMFQAKKSANQNATRMSLQRHMEVVSDLLHCFMPGCSQVRKILNARVPIIKYRHDLTDLECDLSMANSSGYHMSQMLYLYGEWDPRVRPLVFAVRRWAQDRQLTSPFAGRWVTNFSLTLMVLFYLMNVTPRVIPPLGDLRITVHNPTNAPEEAQFLFPSSLRQQPTPSENTDSLETLLREFFKFYDRFNFRENGMSLQRGHSFVKPEHRAMYIQNPLSPDLNVSRNVTLEHLDNIRIELTHARYLLEGSHMSQRGGDVAEEAWGALALWDRFQKPSPVDGAMKYTVNWSSLFVEEQAGNGKQKMGFDVTNGMERQKQTKGKKKQTSEEMNNLVSNQKHQTLNKRYWQNKYAKSNRHSKGKSRY